MNNQLVSVQDIINMLESVPDKSLPCFIFCDGNDHTYRFKDRELGITYDTFEDNAENRHSAIYMLVSRCND